MKFKFSPLAHVLYKNELQTQPFISSIPISCSMQMDGALAMKGG